jgi:MoaA/NifB/PqqE/SkfB family radical SAM enzyme
MMDLNGFKKSLDAILLKSDINHITTSGGGPTLNKNFIEILKYQSKIV